MTGQDREKATERFKRLMDELMKRTGKTLTGLADDAKIDHTTLTRPYRGTRNPPKRETIHKVLISARVRSDDLQSLEDDERLMYAAMRGEINDGPEGGLDDMDPADRLLVTALATRSPERIWDIVQAAVRLKDKAEVAPNPQRAEEAS